MNKGDRVERRIASTPFFTVGGTYKIIDVSETVVYLSSDTGEIFPYAKTAFLRFFNPVEDETSGFQRFNVQENMPDNVLPFRRKTESSFKRGF